MKLTESMLRQIVQEELEAMLSEEEKDKKVDHKKELQDRIKKSQEERGKTVQSEEERDRKAREKGRTLPHPSHIAAAKEKLKNKGSS